MMFLSSSIPVVGASSLRMLMSVSFWLLSLPSLAKHQLYEKMFGQTSYPSANHYCRNCLQWVLVLDEYIIIGLGSLVSAAYKLASGLSAVFSCRCVAPVLIIILYFQVINLHVTHLWTLNAWQIHNISVSRQTLISFALHRYYWNIYIGNACDLSPYS